MKCEKCGWPPAMDGHCLCHWRKLRAFRFGPEWNPVLAVLGVLAVGCVLAMAKWWLGLAFVVGCLVAFALAAYE